MIGSTLPKITLTNSLPPLIGMNMPGGETNDNATPVPGTSGTDYLFAGSAEYNYAAISQAPTYYSSVTGAPFTIAAQSVFGSNGIGGNLILSSGFGSLIGGYVDLQVSGITVAAVEPNKFTFVQGRRRHITQVTGTYNVSLTDDFIAITTLAAPFSIFLPTFPALGDAYEIKDTTGNAGTSNVTVNGNGTNIDGSSSFALAQPYAAATFTFTGTTWSVT